MKDRTDVMVSMLRETASRLRENAPVDDIDEVDQRAMREVEGSNVCRDTLKGGRHK